MKLLASTLLCAAVVGCAHPDGLRVGMTASELDQRFGKPSATRKEGADDVRLYTSAPLGQRASAAWLDPSGRVVRVEPLFDTEHFAKIEVAAWNKQDVLTHFGKPSEVTRIPRYEVWSYRYREAEVWNSLFSIMFDANGVVRQTQNGPDPMYERKDRGMF